MRSRRLYTGRPVPRPLFAAGLIPAETPREKAFRTLSAFRALLAHVRGDEVTMDEADVLLEKIRNMGTTAPSLGRPRITDPGTEGGAN